MIGYCGLDCSKCEAFLATQADNNEQRIKVVKQWSKQYNADIKPQQIYCDGCTSTGRKFFYCENMCEIRKCCINKTLSNCAACEDYACDKLNKFFEFVPQARETLDALR